MLTSIDFFKPSLPDPTEMSYNEDNMPRSVSEITYAYKYDADPHESDLPIDIALL